MKEFKNAYKKTKEEKKTTAERIITQDYTGLTDDKETLIINRQETKSKRLDLLVRPQLKENLKKIANEKDLTLNDLINEILNDYSDANTKAINNYNQRHNK